MKGTILGKGYSTRNVCFGFLYNLYLKQFSSYEEVVEILSQMFTGVQVYYPLFLSDFNLLAPEFYI
jgi:hypothetical protein